GEQIRFDMSQHISGMYFVKLKAGNYAMVKKLILNR
ncbi:MAG: peptidase S8, partial [Chlorobi bacterium]|nr:peptidase S8 [Chlorobiota bacterium]